MTTRSGHDGWGLTEKEKQTLRLIVRGHDAKSSARALGLSVHTINERLRDARRKMAVSSSREAARLLLSVEAPVDTHPDNGVDNRIGGDGNGIAAEMGSAPIPGVARPHSRALSMIGVAIMTILLGLTGLFALSQSLSPAPQQPAAAVSADAAVVAAARDWLELLDRSDWRASYAATGAKFRSLNTLDAWTRASLGARAPLGSVVNRTLIAQEAVPAPPAGYQMVRFRTRFANRADAVETVTLDREGDGWRVVGVYVG